MFSVAAVLAVTRVDGPARVEWTAEPAPPPPSTLSTPRGAAPGITPGVTPGTALSPAGQVSGLSASAPVRRSADGPPARATTRAGVQPGGRRVPATPRRPAGTPAVTRAAAPPVATAADRAPAVSLTVGATISLAPATRPDLRVRHDGARARVDPVGPTSPSAQRAEAGFVVRGGLADGGCVSFESVDEPGSFLRHQNYAVFVHVADDGPLFALDATFCPVPGLDGGTSLRSKNYPDRHLAERDSLLFLDTTAAATRATSFTPLPAL